MKISILKIIFFILIISIVITAVFFGSPNKVTKNETLNDVLFSLGYSDEATDVDFEIPKNGVVLYDAEKSYDGINMFTNHINYPSGGFLIDMRGNVLHRWVGSEDYIWRHFKANPNGEVYVLDREPIPHLSLIDWDSKLVHDFRLDFGLFFHHDFVVDGDTFYLLLREEKEAEYKQKHVRLYDDSILKVENENISKKISLYDMFKDTARMEELMSFNRSNPDQTIDVLHANTLEVLDKDIMGVSKKGDILTCVRNQNLILILDQTTFKIKWQWGSEDLQYPHHPQLLANGNILVFDNGWKGRKYSRIIEMNPKTDEIEWMYDGGVDNRFFTPQRGNVQRLPNGNTLVTVSDSGRVFEVTPDFEIVWDWYNPNRKPNGRRLSVYRMTRVSPDYFTGLEYNYGKIADEERYQKIPN